MNPAAGSTRSTRSAAHDPDRSTLRRIGEDTMFDMMHTPTPGTTGSRTNDEPAAPTASPRRATFRRATLATAASLTMLVVADGAAALPPGRRPLRHHGRGPRLRRRGPRVGHEHQRHVAHRAHDSAGDHRVVEEHRRRDGDDALPVGSGQVPRAVRGRLAVAPGRPSPTRDARPTGRDRMSTVETGPPRRGRHVPHS